MERSADPTLKGFCLQATATGARTFYVAYTSPTTGKRRRMKLGPYPSVSLSKARDLCREARKLIAEGTDPQDHRSQAKQERQAQAAQDAARGTVDDLMGLYVDQLRSDHTRRQVRSIWTRDIAPAIGAKKARDVTPDDVADIMGRILARSAEQGRTGTTLANRARSYLRAAFELGRQAHRMPTLRAKAPPFDIQDNPADEVEKAEKHERPRDRSLTPEELRAVWFGIGEPYAHTVTVTRGGKSWTQEQTATPAPVIALALRWMLATGQRVEEVLSARWDEIDQVEKVWAIPADRRKNRHHNHTREPHLVPLADFHLKLLDEIQAAQADGGPWLFPSPKNPDKPPPTTSFSQAVRRWCDRTGCERFQPRDLRRTWKTLAGRARVDLEIRNRIQGHALQDIGSRSYDRHDYLDEKREGMERWAAWLQRTLEADAASTGTGAVVVPMRAAR
jgi:integrase